MKLVRDRVWSRLELISRVGLLPVVTRCVQCTPDSSKDIKYFTTVDNLNLGHSMPAASFDSISQLQGNDCGIKDVWNHNLHEEFQVIRQVVQKYHWVAMDTEFPGVVARPIGEFRSTADYQYQLLRCNVDLLRIIQLGLTFMDENGKTPPGYTTWQFNFKFNLQEDMYAQDSIDLLQNSGLQFRKHEEDGIDPLEFAELLMSSGLVLIDNIKWLSFHSGYDFGYLLKLLTDQNLPQNETDFFERLRLYFPTVYDVKYLMKLCKNLKGGLQEVAYQLELRRVGPQHQAGSDSHLTGMAFFKIKDIFFDDNIESSSGHLYGLGAPFPVNTNNLQDKGESDKSPRTPKTAYMTSLTPQPRSFHLSE